MCCLFRYQEKYSIKIRNYVHDSTKLCKMILGFDTTSLHLYCSGKDIISCRKNRIFGDEENKREDIKHLNLYIQIYIKKYFIIF